jgi:hypothetical protein
LMAECKHRSDGIYFDRSVLPVTEQNLLNSQDYPSSAVAPRRTGFSGQGVGARRSNSGCPRASGNAPARRSPSGRGRREAWEPGAAAP